MGTSDFTVVARDTEASTTLEAPGRFLGAYVLGPPLGSGGMGVIYQARHRFTGESVAIKTLRQISNESFQRLVREARLMNQVSHPNVINVLEVGLSDDGCPFLVMERLFGFTAADWLERRGRFTEQQLQPILMSTLKGLAAIHEAGILHRDLKPSNLFICMRTGELTNVKIIDLGISASRRSLRITAQGSVPGTPAFLAPEVLDGAPFTEEADLYAAALTIYTLLRGENPLLQPTLPETVQAVHRGGLEPLPKVSDRLNDALLRATSPHPARRGSVADLIEAVRYRGCISSWPAGR